MKTKYATFILLLITPILLCFKSYIINIETYYSTTSDKQTKYFSMKTTKGYGGYDIYKSEKMDDGGWSKPDNLGPTINGQTDEIFPTIDRDNATLYYSIIKGVDTLKYTAVLSDEGFWRDIEPIEDSNPIGIK